MRHRLGIGMAVAAALWLLSPAAAHAEVVLGASAGQTGVEVSDIDFNESDFSWKAFGGFRFFKFFGLQGEYLDFGSPSGDATGGEIDLEGTGWNVAAEGVLPIGKHFELFAKAGYFLWDFKSSVAGLFDEDESGSDFNYGAGAAFIFGEMVGVRVEWQRFEVTDTDSVDFISAGVDLRF